jgi:hypothetical protein
MKCGIVMMLAVVVLVGAGCGDGSPGPAAPAALAESHRNTCINYLRQIDAAKEMVAIKHNKADGQAVAADKVNEYIKGGAPACPAGGAYVYGAIGNRPTCSVDGHALPAR